MPLKTLLDATSWMPHAMTTTSSKFNIFKRERPPPVPEKDAYLSPGPPLGPYASSSFSRSATSVSASSSGVHSMSPRSATLDPSSANGQLPSPASPSSPGKQQNGSSSARSIMTLRKAISKFPSKIPPLPRRPSNNSLATTSGAQSSQSASDDHGDDNISLPWNIHVCFPWTLSEPPCNCLIDPER